MAHNARIRGPADAWANILPSEFAAFDLNLASGVDWDAGGCWAPSSQISIRGAGMQITGPVVVARGGLLISQTAGAWRLYDTNEFPQLGPTHVGRTRTVMFPCAEGRMLPSKAAWYPRFSDGGLQSVAPVIDMSDGRGPQPARLLVPFRAHDASTIAKVVVNYRVSFPHPTLPGTMPMARVIRVNGAGQAVPLTSAASGGDVNGYVAASKPASVNAWSGPQTLTITCDQNNVVDVGQYAYYVDVVEESGLAGYPWVIVVKRPVKAQNIGSNPATLITVDGYALLEGDRVLMNVATTPSLNGVWVAHAGPWARADDLQNPSDYSQGMIVPVLRGAGSTSPGGGTYFQAQSTVKSWTAGTQPYDVVPWPSAFSGVTVGFDVVPNLSRTTGLWYQASAVAGTATTGASEPAWPTTVGQTVIDNPGANQVTWKAMGQAATALPFVARGPDDVETPQLAGTELFAHGQIWQSFSVTFSGITQAAFD